MLLAIVPVLVALAGLLTWALATNGNLKTIGLALFTAGMAAALTLTTGHVVRIP